MGLLRKLLLASLLTGVASAASGAHLVVYTAKKIITMEPALPEATAVAVADGRPPPRPAVSEVTMTAACRTRFSCPVLSTPMCTPPCRQCSPSSHSWRPMTGPCPRVSPPPRLTSPPAGVSGGIPTSACRLSPGAPLWHGEVYRQQLNAWFPNTPVIIWHRSFHELIGNDAACHARDHRGGHQGNHENDWAKGHFWENGLKAVVPKLPFLFEPTRFGKGMGNFLEMAHRGDHST